MINGKMELIGVHKCPKCGALLDAATNIGNDEQNVKPKSNDFTICLMCSQILIFNDDLSVRKVNEAEEFKFYVEYPNFEDIFKGIEKIRGKIAKSK